MDPLPDRKSSPTLSSLQAAPASAFKEFNLNGLSLQCRVLSVYDCDTWTLGFELSGCFYKKSARLLGVDSPEIRSKVPEEAAMAIAGRDCARKLWLGKILQVDMFEDDKYGRVLARVTDPTGERPGQLVSKKMLELGIARAYGADDKRGGQLGKLPWSAAELKAGMAGARDVLA